jgi:hypothetical protein
MAVLYLLSSDMVLGRPAPAQGMKAINVAPQAWYTRKIPGHIVENMSLLTHQWYSAGMTLDGRGSPRGNRKLNHERQGGLHGQDARMRQQTWSGGFILHGQSLTPVPVSINTSRSSKKDVVLCSL